MKRLILLTCAVLAMGRAAIADDIIERTGRDSIAIKPAAVAIPGAVSVGTLTVSGTSYGGTIQATTFVSPTTTGTNAGNFVRSGTTMGGTLASPTITGTNAGTVVHSGTQTISGKLIIASGTSAPVSGQLAVSGTNILFYNGSAWVQLNN